MNDALAAVLRTKRKAWQTGVVLSENTGKLRNSKKRPDILIAEPLLPPVIIETEVLPAATVEEDARSRLGQPLQSTSRGIYSVIAVRLPIAYRRLDGLDLRAAMEAATDLEFVLLAGKGPTDYKRWPASGWLTGGVSQLAAMAEFAVVPPELVEEAADILADGIASAAGVLAEAAPAGSGAMTHICQALHQADNEQTARMAMTIVVNAFMFHERLAGGAGPLAEIRNVEQIRSASGSSGKLSKAETIKEWRRILDINYWPIFDIARAIVEHLPSAGAVAVIEQASVTAARLIEHPLSRSHALTGVVFQRLIADRKFLAAFYTQPASAALLAAMAFEPRSTPTGQEWGNRTAVESLRVGDFACGTGTLLSAAYHRITQLHEEAGGDGSAIHAAAMSRVLVGCDVMPAATHLTASMLSAAHPAITYGRSLIMTVPYGLQPGRKGVALGSLDLLCTQATFSVLDTHATVAGGRGALRAEARAEIRDGTFDAIIMNPPYTRATGHEGERVGNVPIPMFAAFAKAEEEQRAMGEAFKLITKGTVSHGNAGEASAFLALADRKLKVGGRLALVLPLSILAGEAWAKARELLRKSYSDLVVFTISGRGDAESSFSADTGSAECLIVGTKIAEGSERATFVVLTARPENELQAAEIANAVQRSIAEGSMKTLEAGPVGGTLLNLGDDPIGCCLDGPLSQDSPWQLSRVADFSVAQTAFNLQARGCLWLPGVPRKSAVNVPIVALATLAERGPYHMDIDSAGESNGIPRGPFDVRSLSPDLVPTYPVLWNHDADRERSIVVEPDSEGIIKSGKAAEKNQIIQELAAKIWESAAHAHLNRDFRFNAGSIAVAYTESPSIGGRAWPAVIFANAAHARLFALWSNSTLGLLLYWWLANKQQSGRGSITISVIPKLPTLDLRQIGEQRFESADRLFADMRGARLRPFNEIDDDTTRHELDRRLLVDVLGVDAGLVAAGGPLDLLRRKLSQEPSIRGSKRGS